MPSASPKPEKANEGWFKSPGHFPNMFRSRFRRVGIGVSKNRWTQMFG